jgi:hypothetical protein
MVDWALCTANTTEVEATDNDGAAFAIGFLLALFSGVFLALSMSVQRYALSFPTYQVQFLFCRLPRPVVWMLGFIFYCIANGLFAIASHYTPLTLNATLFTLLLVWNLIFAWLLLGEKLTRTRVVGAIVIVLGAAISVGGTPTDARTAYGPNDLGELVTSPGGLAYLILQVLSGLITASAVVWFERSFSLSEEEVIVRRVRNRTLAFSVIFDGGESAALQEKATLQRRWDAALRSVERERDEVAQGRKDESQLMAMVRTARASVSEGDTSPFGSNCSSALDGAVDHMAEGDSSVPATRPSLRGGGGGGGGGGARSKRTSLLPTSAASVAASKPRPKRVSLLSCLPARAPNGKAA